MPEDRGMTPFRERSTGPGWMPIAGILTFALLAFVAWLAIPELVAHPESMNGWLLAVVVGATIMVLIAVLLLIMRRATVVVTATHVDVYLDPFRIMHISHEVIESVEETHVSFADAQGWGWRLAGTEQYLLWSAGPAVRLQLTRGGARILRSDRTAELMTAIAQARSDPSHS